MLGRTLHRKLRSHEVHGIDLTDCDIAQADQVRSIVESCHPEVVIHCAAMTAVDACEAHPDEAMAINAGGSENVARAASEVGARLIAFSTDYVFAGDLDRPYREVDSASPASVYGKSKLAGELAIRRSCPNHLICRVAWLYGEGGPSFLHTMLRLGREEGPPLKVVKDQCGNPTSCDAVADMIARLLRTDIVGLLHLTCEGEGTWYDFACEIFRLKGCKRTLHPCTTREFPRPAPRPSNSRLENRNLKAAGMPLMPDWRQALKDFFASYPNG